MERAWCKVAREAVVPGGHVVPQQWLVNTTAPGIAPDDRQRLDLVIYGATPLDGALCCDATLVSPLTRDGEPHPGVAAVLRTAYRGKQATYPELAAGGAPELCVLGCEVGGRWNADAVKLVQRLVALGAHRAPPSACESFLGLLLVESALRSGSASRRSHSAGTRPGLAGTGTCRCAGPG